MANNNNKGDLWTSPSKISYLLTSSADCAMKNPTVLAGSLVPLGLMEILLSFPSSPLTSIAKSSNFNLTKHNLKGIKNICEKFQCVDSGMFPEVLFRCKNVGRQRDFANF